MICVHSQLFILTQAITISGARQAPWKVEERTGARPKKSWLPQNDGKKKGNTK